MKRVATKNLENNIASKRTEKSQSIPIKTGRPVLWMRKKK